MIPVFKRGKIRGVQKTEHAGFSFASKLEAAVYDVLCLMEKAGEIRDIRCQVHVYLTDARIGMIPDFSAFDIERNETAFYEAKGFETDVYRIKRKLWTAYGPGPLFVYKGSYKAPVLHETIFPSKPIS